MALNIWEVMLRGSALTARVRSGKGEDVVEIQSKKKKEGKNGFEREKHLTCDVNISGGGVQGCRRPGSTAVAGSDAFES